MQIKVMLNRVRILEWEIIDFYYGSGVDYCHVATGNELGQLNLPGTHKNVKPSEGVLSDNHIILILFNFFVNT
jgi:hypothetical protein